MLFTWNGSGECKVEVLAKKAYWLRILRTSKYIAGINGLRAIAAIAVLLSHVTGNWGVFKLGWIGVDMFFVISGFLITKILLENREAKNYFKAFYSRRAIRILPIYFIVVFPLVVFHLWRDIVPVYVPLSYLIYFQNSFIMNYGWLQGLGHTWTLAIEEQFYIFFPVVLFFVKREYLLFFFVSAIALIVGLRFYFYFEHYSTYYVAIFTISRMDGFLIGGIVALLTIIPSRFSRETLNLIFNSVFIFSILSLLLLMIYFGNSALGICNKFFLGFDNFKVVSNYSSSLGHIKYTLLSLLFAAIIGKVVFRTSALTIKMVGWLEKPFIRKLGEISYGIYLYHYVYVSLFRFMFQLNEADVVTRIIMILFIIVATYFTALVSYKYIEIPILSLRRPYAHSVNW